MHSENNSGTIEARRRANKETRAAWEENATFWDERMGEEGNDFVNVLIWPSTQRLLQLQPGERVLDIACGNGLYARRLAALGGEVVAFDFSENLVEIARRRTAEHAGIAYHVIDATDETALLALGERGFDAALCQMALFDMAEIEPLMRALVRLLRPGGRFVFSVMHPCFNNPHMSHMAEVRDDEGVFTTIYSVKVTGYMTASLARGAAIPGQPRPQVYFHRPLQVLLGAALSVGFVLDGLEELAFPADHPPGRSPLAWGGNYSEIPPVLVVRMRLPV